MNLTYCDLRDIIAALTEKLERLISLDDPEGTVSREVSRIAKLKEKLLG